MTSAPGQWSHTRFMIKGLYGRGFKSDCNRILRDQNEFRLRCRKKAKSCFAFNTHLGELSLNS